MNKTNKQIEDNRPTEFDIPEIRLSKLIQIFEPLYNTASEGRIKNIYKEHLTDLKTELRVLQDGKRKQSRSNIESKSRC